ncbi:unnamed protein product [Absidia cylindrospora]
MPLTTFRANNQRIFASLDDYREYRDECFMEDGDFGIAALNSKCVDLSPGEMMGVGLCGINPVTQEHVKCIPTLTPLDLEEEGEMDIDAVVIETSEPPCVGRVELSFPLLESFKTPYKAGHKLMVGAHAGNVVEYHRIPNLCIATFGNASIFKLAVFFPMLYDKNQNDINIPQLFLDKLLLPALRRILPNSVGNRLPLDGGHAVRLYRAPFGQMCRGDVVVCDYQISRLGTVMRQMVLDDENDDDLACFSGLFFLSYGFGLKCPMDSLQDFTTVFASELNMYTVMQSDSIFVDVACERFDSAAGRTCLWQVSNVNNKDIKHLKILHPFFDGLVLIKSNYRYDSFLGFHSLAGCDYGDKNRHTLLHGSLLGVHAVKLYTTFKHPFYFRTTKTAAKQNKQRRFEDTRRYTKTLSAFDIWENGAKLNNYFNFINATTDKMMDSGCGYSARIEATISLKRTLSGNNEAKLYKAIHDAYIYAGSIPTKDLCELIVHRGNAIRLAAANLKDQNAGSRDPKQLSACALLAYMSSTLLSRPVDWSWYRPVARYVHDHKCQQSDLLFLPLGFQLDSNACLGALDPFSRDQLKAIFYSTYADITRTRRSPATSRPLVLVPTKGLEGTFGFLSPTRAPHARDSMTAASHEAPIVLKNDPSFWSSDDEEVDPSNDNENHSASVRPMDQGNATTILTDQVPGFWSDDDDDQNTILPVNASDFSVPTQFSLEGGNFSRVFESFRENGIGETFIKCLVRCWFHDCIGLLNNVYNYFHADVDLTSMDVDVFRGNVPLDHVFKMGKIRLRPVAKNNRFSTSIMKKVFVDGKHVTEETFPEMLQDGNVKQSGARRAYLVLVFLMMGANQENEVIHLREALAGYLDQFQYLPILRCGGRSRWRVANGLCISVPNPL